MISCLLFFFQKRIVFSTLLIPAKTTHSRRWFYGFPEQLSFFKLHTCHLLGLVYVHIITVLGVVVYNLISHTPEFLPSHHPQTFSYYIKNNAKCLALKHYLGTYRHFMIQIFIVFQHILSKSVVIISAIHTPPC